MKAYRLSDPNVFRTLNGLWTGKKEPLVKACVLRNTNFGPDGILDPSDVAKLQVEKRQLDKRQLERGDIILERSGGSPKQPVGRVAFFDLDSSEPFSFSNFTSALRVLDRSLFEPRFVHYFLLDFYFEGGTKPLQSNTTGLRNLNFDSYLQTEVPCPPIDEQRKIAAVLGKVQAAVAVEGDLVRVARELKQAALRQLFTRGLRREPTRESRFGTVPAAWGESVLSDCAYVQTGIAKNSKNHRSDDIEIPYLRVANVQDGRLDLREMKNIQVSAKDAEACLLQVGDVVLTEGGDFDKLGRGFIWEGQIERCVHQNHVFAVRTNRDRLDSRFFAYLAQSPYGKAYFLAVAHKTTNLACINTTKLRAFPVLLPPPAEQREIAALLATLDAKIAHHEARQALLRELFRTLLHDLLTARRRVTSLDLDHLADANKMIPVPL